MLKPGEIVLPRLSQAIVNADADADSKEEQGQ